ncbi:unnamed protein product, partial [Owenia fusiformis]
NVEYYGPEFGNIKDSGTSHLSVLGPDGLAVSITSTINLLFGAYWGKSTGIIYNNNMNDFSIPNTINYFGLPASPANFIQPKKRPLSSMNPTIITDSGGDVVSIIGSSGGSKITTATAYNIIRNLWFG